MDSRGAAPAPVSVTARFPANLEVQVSDDATSPRADVPSRRVVVGGLLGLGVGIPLLAACGSGGGDGGTTTSGPIGKTSEVPIGGGKIFQADKVVITQPTAGDFKAFSAICTHQGCIVAKIEGKDIDCTCHNSKFSIADGSVVRGPATKPLQALQVTVNGDELSVA
jgi:nitrite reductase/ring-hydroxylating ferredoxin subunit